MSFVPQLAEEIEKAIKQDYLIVILISSHTQAAKRSVNLPYGLGKSTALLWFLRGLTGSWDAAFERLTYNPVDFYRLIQKGREKRHAAVSWDDVQMTAPAERSVPKHILKIANKISVSRPETGVVFFTAPNMNSISAPLRRIVTHELIVWERGQYEGQRYIYLKNYKDPKVDNCKMYPCGDGTFPKLPAEIEARYEAWRDREKQKIGRGDDRAITNACHLYEVPLPGQTTKISGKIIKSGNSYYVAVPPEIGQKLHHQEVDMVIPS